MIPATEALVRLRDGNARFVGDRSAASTSGERRRELLAGQQPFAVIVGCSDSRVPPEVVFDQGLGDLFVIRVAGNIVAPSQMGSVEFAVEAFGTRLVVVLGHKGCGAVKATFEQLESGGGAPSAGLAAIVDQIRPAVEPLLGDADRMARGVRQNIASSVAALRSGSPILERLASDGLAIVGAEYSLETGLVEFLDGA